MNEDLLDKGIELPIMEEFYTLQGEKEFKPAVQLILFDWVAAM